MDITAVNLLFSLDNSTFFKSILTGFFPPRYLRVAMARLPDETFKDKRLSDKPVITRFGGAFSIDIGKSMMVVVSRDKTIRNQMKAEINKHKRKTKGRFPALRLPDLRGCPVTCSFSDFTMNSLIY
jgi:hypothetical protein